MIRSGCGIRVSEEIAILSGSLVDHAARGCRVTCIAGHEISIQDLHRKWRTAFDLIHRKPSIVADILSLADKRYNQQK